METASDIERNRRIIALSQFVSSFFDTEKDTEEADFSLGNDALISDDATEPPQTEIVER